MPLAPPTPLDWTIPPHRLVRAWNPDHGLVVWGAGVAAKWSRWAVFARPTAAKTLRIGPRGTADQLERAFESIRATRREISPPTSDDQPPFHGGWIGYLGYGLGKLLEPAACVKSPPPDDRRWPLMVLQRCESAVCYDKAKGRWWSVGAGGTRTEPVDAPRMALTAGMPPQDHERSRRDRFCAMVERAREYIRAGDVYQVNLAHRLVSGFVGSARAMFATLCTSAEPWYGAYLEDSEQGVRRALLSASPELLFEFNQATRRVVTRPMKGTMPIGAGSERLRKSDKDRAELAMITDLMRNDLGRVCALGSVGVEAEREIEPHGTVVQGVSSVSGRLRDGADALDIIRAVFPGGSVTGAPKIRAMQIIEELENAQRGPYCGAIGYLSDCGGAAFSVAIRTAAITGLPGPTHFLDPDTSMDIHERMESGEKVFASDGFAEAHVDYWVGAGIVADSRPESEWDETLAKMGPLTAAFALKPEHVT